MDFDQALKRHVLAISGAYSSLFKVLVVAISRSSPSFSYLRVNKSLFRWTCASYQATFRNPSFGGPVSHIKHQLKSGSIIGSSATHCVTVKIFEADQRRLFSQFEVREFCDNLVEGVVKALNDDFEEKSFDYPHQGPLLDTRRPLDDGLGPIFDEVDELGPTFDEKAPSMTSINMENHLCFDPGTTPTPLTTDIQEHCEKLDFINYLSQMCVKISSKDVKRFGFDKVKEFHVSDFVYENMFNSFKVFEPDELLDQKRFHHDNGINSGFVLSFHQFLKHSKGFDHFEESLELDLQQLDFCARNSVDPWISNSRSEIDLLCSKSEKLAHVLNLFFSNCAITCPETILVYNTYFDRLHDDLKCVLHILGKETLVSYLNKYLSCTYNPGILMFILSVQDKQDQSPRGARNRSRDRAYKFEIGDGTVTIYVHCLTHIFQTKRLLRMKSLVECSQLNYGAPRRRIRSSYVTVMPFTNQVIFSSREFRPPEKLKMANLLSDEPTTNSIMQNVIIHVLNVQESLGIDGLQKKNQKQTCLGQIEKPIKIG
ncbi:hypothetical protein YC2023_043229 [Brassica napus]